MKIEGKFFSTDLLKGFVKITELGKAQQVTVESKQLISLLRCVKALADMGFKEITITVEKGKPLIIGGKRQGIALAPLIGEDDT